MKPVLTPEEAAALDRDTQSRGIAAEALMERAGRAVARAARELAGGTYGRCTHCGIGIPIERLEFLPYASRCVACQASTA